jgi:hypothetical protein
VSIVRWISGLGSWAVCLAAASGCAARSAAVEPLYVRVAEGLTSPTSAEGIAVAPRMLSAPELVRACQDPRITQRLESPTRSLQLRLGERLPLNTLAIVAVNDANEAMVPPIPIAIEALDTSPPVLQLRSDDPDLNAARIYPLNLGTFRLRISSLCGIRPAQLIIDGLVTP